MRKNNELGMTGLAIELAKTAVVEGNIASFRDDRGEIKVDLTQGVFVRIHPDGRTTQYKSGQLSKAEKNYGVIPVRIAGVNKTIYQHIMMACLTHMDTYKEGLIVGHKDSVKWHNTPDNLEWVTDSQNKQMESLMYKLQTKYPGVYTILGRNLHGDLFIASKIKISHKDIDKILAVIDDPDALDDVMNYL